MRAAMVIRRKPVLSAAGLALVILVAFTGSASAATFTNESPPSGVVRTVTANTALSVGVVAAAGQTLYSIATLSVDGASPVSAYASYVIDHWEDYEDPEYGVTYPVPVYDYTKATFSVTTLLPSSLSSHSAVMTVTEQPSGQTFTYTWSFPGETCKGCHDGYSLGHDPATLSSCSVCHTASGPSYYHNATWPAFNTCSRSSCHALSSHGFERLEAHTYYNLDGEPYPKEERTCSSCHTGGYSGITQITGPHGDPGAKHAGMWDPQCANQCHGGGDPAEFHESCETCHPDGGPDPAPGSTCLTCHPDYHTKAVSTPSSSPWSLGLIAVVGLGVVLTARRARTAV